MPGIINTDDEELVLLITKWHQIQHRHLQQLTLAGAAATQLDIINKTIVSQ